MSGRGIDFSLLYIGEILGNVSGGIQRGAAYEGLLKAQLDFDTEPLAIWKRGSFRVSALYPHGRSFSENYLGDLFTLSSIDADDSVRLFELWYEHQVVPEWLSFRVGQLAADEEFTMTESGSVFIDGTVGWPAIIALNAATPAYPAATPGARLALDLGSDWSIQSGVYNGDPTPSNDAGEDLNQHGVCWSFHDLFLITELKHGWKRALGSAALPGQAKLGGWFHTGRFDHQRLDDAHRSRADLNSTGQPLQLRGNWGLYATLEQKLWPETPALAPARGLAAFARLGGAPADRNLLQFYAESGLTYTGLLPQRNEDVCGVAVVFGHLSDETRRLAAEIYHAANTAGSLPDFETVVEATYRIALRPGVTLQPLAAYIIHPGGAANENALVFGIRFILDL